MGNRSPFLLAVPALLLLMSTAAVAAPRNPAPEAPLVVGGDKKERGNNPVVYRHKVHKSLSCRMCHHKDERNEEQRCSGCHEEKGESGMPGLKDAFHAKCKGCHVRIKKGPKVCTGCHRLPTAPAAGT
jgi:hypothetical protein